ncbi:MAG: PhoH family protein [Bacillota bacterium]
MKKIYVIDTSVMMHDPLFYEKFEDNNIVIPIQALEELRKLKNASGLKGFQAREAARKIKDLFNSEDINVTKGVELKDGGSLRIEINHMDLELLPNALDKNVTDYKIISIAKSLENSSDNPVIMVSKDIDIWIVCKAIGLTVEDYMNDRVESDHLFDGLVTKEVNSEKIDKFYEQKFLKKDKDKDEDIELFPNIGILLKSFDKSALATYKNQKLKKLKENEIPYLKGRNVEQKIAIDMLLDSDIDLVTITGGAGSGKTYITIAVAFYQLLKQDKFNKLILIKPTQETDLGYLPGSEKEKLNPYMASYYDTFSKILPPYFNNSSESNNVKSFIDELIEQGKLEMKNFSYLRGRSLDDSLIIVDECQQITPHFAKLILTRAGINTKIVLLGDVSDNQIDVKYVDSKSNGLAYIVEKFKKSKLAGHMTLKSVERSSLANEAEKIL